MLYLTVNPSLFRRTGTERIARTGFWLSLFRFQGATGHTPIKPELVPGVPKDCSRRTAAAGKSPSGAGRLGGLSGGRVTLSGARARVNAFRHETAYPRRHPGPNARYRWYPWSRPNRRIPLVPLTRDFRRRRPVRRQSAELTNTPMVPCGEPLRPSARHPVSGAQQAFRSRSAPSEPPWERSPPVDHLDLPQGTSVQHHHFALPLLHRRDTAMTFRPNPAVSLRIRSGSRLHRFAVRRPPFRRPPLLAPASSPKPDPPAARPLRAWTRSGPRAPRSASGARSPP